MTLSGSNMKTSPRPKNPFGSLAGNTVFLQVFCLHDATCCNAPKDFFSVALCFLSSQVTANLAIALQSVCLLAEHSDCHCSAYFCRLRSVLVQKVTALVVIGTCVVMVGAVAVRAGGREMDLAVFWCCSHV